MATVESSVHSHESYGQAARGVNAKRWGEEKSARRPPQAPPTENVEVEVGNGLSSVLAHVRHHSVPRLLQPQGPSRLPGGEKEVAGQRLVFLREVVH